MCSSDLRPGQRHREGRADGTSAAGYQGDAVIKAEDVELAHGFPYRGALDDGVSTGRRAPIRVIIDYRGYAFEPGRVKQKRLRVTNLGTVNDYRSSIIVDFQDQLGDSTSITRRSDRVRSRTR